MDLNNEINREKSCITDLLKQIELHVQAGRYDLVAERTKDILRSIENIQKLENKRRFYTTINKLVNQGILVEAVKKLEKVV